MFSYLGSGGGFPILAPEKLLRINTAIGATFAADTDSEQFINIGGFRVLSFFISVDGRSVAPVSEVQCELTWYLQNGFPALGDFQQLRRTVADPGKTELDLITLPAVPDGVTSRFVVSAANPGGALACRLRFRDTVASVLKPLVTLIGKGST
jgi:hypothetical protein